MRVLVAHADTPLGAAIVRDLHARDVEDIIPCTADLCHARIAHDAIWNHPGLDAVINPGCHVRELLAACAGHPSVRRFVQYSSIDVYRAKHDLIDEDGPLDLHAPCAEADVIACEHLADRIELAILRLAHVLAPGDRLHDYLAAPVRVRPLGFDPMIDALALDDAAAAFGAALDSAAVGVFNIPGGDPRPLSRVLAGHPSVPVPRSLIPRRFQFGGVLDGTRARIAFGYTPRRSPWSDDASRVPSPRTSRRSNSSARRSVW